MLKRCILGCVSGVVIAMYMSLFVPDIAYVLQGPGWSDGSDGFDPYGMMNWLLLLLPIWFQGLWEYENMLGRAHMIVYRYRSAGVWWIKTNVGIICRIVLVYLVMWLTLVLLLWNDWNQLMSLSVIMIVVHGLALLAVSVWLRLLTGSMIVSAVSILVPEVMAKILVAGKILSPAESIFSWGMSDYSSRIYGSGGFDIAAVLIIQAIFVLTPVFFMQGSLKRILLRRVSDGKIH